MVYTTFSAQVLYLYSLKCIRGSFYVVVGDGLSNSTGAWNLFFWSVIIWSRPGPHHPPGVQGISNTLVKLLSVLWTRGPGGLKPDPLGVWTARPSIYWSCPMDWNLIGCACHQKQPSNVKLRDRIEEG